MKNRFAAFLVARSKLILIIFIILALGFGVLIPFVNVNRDMTKYLPEDSDMRHGLDLMEAEFGNEESSTLKIMFDDLKNAKEKKAMRRDLKTLPNASSVDYAPAGSKDGEDYNRENHTLYIVNCDYDQYSDEAAELWAAAQERYADSHEIALGGTIDSANHNGLPLWIAASAVGLIFLVLLIMASSWIEPVAFLVTVGVAVLINMGSYIFFEDISKTTFSIVAVLQLALSMDYSIMLLNRYRQCRRETTDKYQAMQRALSLSFGAITGSSLTTFAGLLALVFMSFAIGADIGLALAKGVIISLICIFTVLPAMLLGLDSLMLQTVKRTPPFDLPRLSGFQNKARIPLTLLFLALFLAGFIARSGVDFSYAQYGSGDVIDEAFGYDNTIVMVYDEADSKAAGKLAVRLDDREDVKSAVCYESTLGKSRSAAGMKTFIEDMRDSSDNDTDTSDMDLTDSMLRLIYYDYFTGEPQLRMSIPRFVSYLQYDVMNDPDFGDSIDEETRDQIDDMERFTNVPELTSAKGAGALADFFGMSTDQARQLLLYYQIKSGKASGGEMSLPAFVNFLIEEVAEDPDYGSMITASSLNQLKSMRQYTDKKKMTVPRTYRTAAGLLGMKRAQMRMIYVNHHMLKDRLGKRTIADVADILGKMAKDPALKKQFGTPEIEHLIMGLQMIGQMDPSEYRPKQMVKALAGYGMPLDRKTLRLIYAYGDIKESPASHKLSVQKLIHYMLGGKAISKTLSKAQKQQLQRLRTIVDTSVSGKKLSAASMGSLLGMSSSDVRSIYLLWTYHHGDTSGWKLTPQQFINFLADKVLSDPEMKKQVGGSADDLKMAQKIINHSVAGTEFNYHELADLLGAYSEEMSEDDLSMLYELYGSEHEYDKSWRMNLMQLVKHLDEEMIDRPAFASSIGDEQIQDVREMRADLDEAAEKLHGKHYGRMMISADLDEDSDTTRAFMDQLTGYTSDRFGEKTYLIGTTPMAYEMSQTFHSELNKLTILTALFILIIVLLTFRRLATPIILVLIIQCAVFLTMSVMNMANVDMNYLALLIVQSIMMGATIDYAIIYSTYYIENRALMPPGDAIRAAYKGSLQTILTSATILIAAVGVLSFAFSEPATGQICRILSIGCLIATLLVIFLLPGILACLDRFVVKRGNAKGLE